MIYVHKEGKVAEYTPTEDGYLNLTKRPDGEVWFENKIYLLSNMPENWFNYKEEALQAAMDYHEAEGCALYLELYPAPEKGDYLFIAQDSDGEWCGFYEKPFTRGQTWDDSVDSYNFIQSSPPNPFWRKTLR